jgi:peptide/nickel transport system substrate-binding protein
LSDLEVPILRADQARSRPQPNGELDGLGPYRASSARPGEVVLEPADTGVFARPAHAVVVRTVRDENARALRLLAGESDIAPNAISPGLLPALERESELFVVARAGANVTYLLMQNDRPPFDRLEVRRAVAHAIDRELIVRTLLAGRARVAKSLLPPDHWAAAPELTAEPFAPAAARAVLTDLPPVTLLTSTDRARVTLARVLAQMLRDAGLTVEVVALDLGVLLERLDAGDYLMATLQLPELTEPNVLSWFFHPDKIPGEGSEGKNRARYRSPEARAELDRASRVRDPAQRRESYQRFARLLQRDVPVIPLWHEDQIAVVSRRARDFELSAEGRWLAVARLQ